MVTYRTKGGQYLFVSRETNTPLRCLKFRHMCQFFLMKDILLYFNCKKN